jgi:hypothetical protein
VSPSVKAGVALSNLQLLQHLSTGRLQHALDNVGSPTSEQVLQQHEGLHPSVAAAMSISGADSTASPTSTGQLLPAAGHVATGAVHTAASLGQVADGSGQCQSRSAARYAELPLLDLSTSPHPYRRFTTAVSAGLPAKSTPGAHVQRSLQDCMTSSGSAAAAAVALAAATAAVHQIPASTYGRSIGMQRYAADAAVLDSFSQEHRQPDLSEAGTGARIFSAAVAGRRCSPDVYASPPTNSSGFGHAVRPSSSTGRSHAEEQQLVLRRSAAAAVSTAVMLNEAGKVLHSYASPSQSVSSLQLQLQDPVTAALQEEVARLRQEVSRRRSTGVSIQP